MIREKGQHVLRDFTHVLIRGGDLDTKVVDPADVEPLVHKLFPEVQAVACSLNYLSLEFDELLFEVVDLNYVQRCLVFQQSLVLAVHNVLDTLLSLVQEVLVL